MAPHQFFLRLDFHFKCSQSHWVPNFTSSLWGLRKWHHPLVQQVSKKTATAAASPSSSHLWEFIQVRLYLLNFSHSPIFIEEKSLLNKANPFTGALDFPSLWPPQRCYSTQLCFLAWPSAISSLLASPFPTQMCSLLAIILSLASPQQSEKENIAGAVSIFSPFIFSSR